MNDDPITDIALVLFAFLCAMIVLCITEKVRMHREMKEIDDRVARADRLHRQWMRNGDYWTDEVDNDQGH